MTVMRIASAAREYKCCDCSRPIQVSDEYCNVNEYGEKRQLHRACAELRLVKEREEGTVRGRPQSGSRRIRNTKEES